MITGHGDDAYLYENIRTDFSSNIFSHADLSELKAYLSKRLEVIGHYPEPEAARLEREIASQRGVPAECVIVTNGATDAIYLVSQTLVHLGVTHFMVKHPTFSEYADACRQYGQKEGEADVMHTSLWLCNPNNPTGEAYPPSDIIHQTERYRMVVVDQSYEDYTLHRLLPPSDALTAGNIVLIYSLTKTYAVPGLRIGYVITPPSLANRLRQFLRPWSVNALAIEAGLWLIRHQEKAVDDLEAYLSEAQRLRRNLSAIDGIDVRATATHFMLCRSEAFTAAELKEKLAHEYHILIRDASNFTGLDAHYFRVAAQTREENDLLVRAIGEITTSLPPQH